MRATCAAQLEFTDQKNMIRGEVLAHGRSGHYLAFSIATLSRHLLHLRSHGVTPLTPLYHVYTTPGEANVTSALVTAAIRVAAASTHYDFSPSNMNARALRAGGAMALLCARVNTNIIKMVGRWRSDSMFRYLHLQAFPLMRSLGAPLMLQGGSFTLPPGHDLPRCPLRLHPPPSSTTSTNIAAAFYLPEFSEIHPLVHSRPGPLRFWMPSHPSHSIGLLQLRLNNGLDTGSDVRCGAS
jgi:hypothetical protein